MSGDRVERAVKRAVAEGTSLSADTEIASNLSPDALVRAMRPRNYLGEAAALVARVLKQPRT